MGKIYLKNSDLLAEYKVAKSLGKITNELAKMFILLVKKLSSSGRFTGYTYKDIMESEALEMLCRYWANFNEEKGTNIFAYYSMIAWNAFLIIMKKEKKQHHIKDEVRIANGMEPSYGYKEQLPPTENRCAHL